MNSLTWNRVHWSKVKLELRDLIKSHAGQMIARSLHPSISLSPIHLSSIYSSSVLLIGSPSLFWGGSSSVLLWGTIPPTLSHSYVGGADLTLTLGWHQ